nr:NAD(P)H-dependent oxidoreductase [Frankia canadensis]
MLLGSVRAGRLGPTVAAWFATLAQRRDDVRLDLVDPAALPHIASPAAGSVSPGDPGTNDAGTNDAGTNDVGTNDVGTPATRETVGRRLAAADGFVVVTPEYNHSYPAALKHLIDDYRQEWYAKPVGFVSYGGVSGGLRAVEHLRAVFAEQHAVTVRDSVSLHGVSAADFADGGRVAADGGTAAAVDLLLDRMSWWGRALRVARDSEPYA